MSSLSLSTPPTPTPLAPGLLLLISPQASESSLKGTDASVHFGSLLVAAPSLIAALAHLRRPQSEQINNAGASIPPATPVIGWKRGCCSAWPHSRGRELMIKTRVETHAGI